MSKYRIESVVEHPNDDVGEESGDDKQEEQQPDGGARQDPRHSPVYR